ncbi:AAA family ATPase [Flavobacterium johnsoniae]|uniref:AAA ATPase, central domain protein n=1 Tax=Flavobacterium johnsoniae (strain ATCC 17061 / DSM 2064 / JCM 8514 / BCRC 14874 / CCUG 350202 / NBRC 14942 / NCIMB 11054 / UW101) TaxID=376686 RepID=A5FGK6_FLAJ1|nr:ATP-binding protein [Flavobacterium johnsoniae]ABQ05667.1 AAA ATPase, central domain protein [Flavobacterium johnsoniae UW101]OXG00063.1 AAA family ATPase [Flavobacterium johnsoniae UW101]WQG82526.1 ATP-binding protein [Flavobacterium johnsoniae UW101]SHL50418.1 ATPase family associated with various cellular activities (AAA) [Flavobacterium johnsoniae]
MNQALLTRLFKSIEGDQDQTLIKIAFSIIEDEKKKGHSKLAERLNSILLANISKSNEYKPTLKVAKDFTYKVPVDRRYKLPLAVHIPHENLRHEMVLPSSVENKLLRIEKEYLARERLANHGLKPRKKALLYGSSGCGKSMAAERIAWNLGLPFYKVRFDSIISSYLGESASNLQNLFESIQDYPCVLLLDEFDIIGKQRNTNSNDVGEIHRIVNILLGLLEEYEGEGILIATTNLEGSLDQALFRRFDDFIELPKPSHNEVVELLKISFSALKINKNINLEYYAEKMKGMSYAIVVKIANDAAKKAVISSSLEISIDDLNSALDENKAMNR